MEDLEQIYREHAQTVYRFLLSQCRREALAVVENLGEVHWDDPTGQAEHLTLEEANASLAALSRSTNAAPYADVKAYAQSVYDLQLLNNLLS